MVKKIQLTEEQLRRLTGIESGNNGETDLLSYFNLDCVSKEELDRQYVDLSEMEKFIGYTGRFINEDAKATQSADDTKEEIQRKFGLSDWQFATFHGSNGIELIILYAKTGFNSMLIKRAMKSCGWHVSREQECNIDGKVWKCMSFDPMYQDSVTNDARKYGYLFHWTPAYQYESINKHGLVPKNGNKEFKYPDRVYLMKGDINRSDIFALGKQLCASNTDKRNNGEYMLIVIDLFMHPDTFELYLDPRYEYGYYTNEKIPASAIVNAKKFNLRNIVQNQFITNKSICNFFE